MTSKQRAYLKSIATNLETIFQIGKGGITDEIYVDGMFIAIGQQPENEPFVNVASIDANGYLISDESCVVNKNAGVFAAGDCRTKKIRQITTATADGAVAAIAACKML